jgi:aspartyl protease family protein
MNWKALGIWLLMLAALWALFDYQLNRPATLVRGAQSATVTIPRSLDGHYYVQGTVNGHPVRFMVDTGASYTSLGGALAGQIGLPEGEPIRFNTAAGPAIGALVRGQGIGVAGLQFEDMTVAVSPAAGHMALLGQNVLRHFVLTQTGAELTLHLGNGRGGAR